MQPCSHVIEAFLLAEEDTTIGEIVNLLQSDIAPKLEVVFEEVEPPGASRSVLWAQAPRLSGWFSRITLRDGLSDYFDEAV